MIEITSEEDNVWVGRFIMVGGTISNIERIDLRSALLILKDDQISGDKIEGGTIDSITINNLDFGTS